MGAGCYYTNNITKTKEFWVVLPTSTDDPLYNIFLEDMLVELDDIFNDLGYIGEKSGIFKKYINDLYTIHLEFTYYDDGIVIKLNPTEDNDLYDESIKKHHETYSSIADILINHGFLLKIASSGYTSMKFNGFNN